MLVGIGCAAPTKNENVSSEYVNNEHIGADLDRPSIKPEDLGATAEELSSTGRKTLDLTPSKGRFPAGVAIARIVSAVSDPNDPRKIRITETPTDQAAYWNGLLDSLPPVREVALIRGQGLDPRGAAWDDVLKQSEKIDCRLCLIYGRSNQESGDADLVGVLWDAQETKALVAFRTPLVMDDGLPEAEEQTPLEGVFSPPELDAEQHLRELVRDAVWDLARRDAPSATTQPSPWQTEESLTPRGDQLIIEIKPKLQRGR
jgi:hypothetical protein